MRIRELTRAQRAARRAIVSMRINGKQAHTYDDRNAIICVSAEHGDGLVDYYGEGLRGPWIHPDLEAAAKRHGCYWEWINPSAIGLYS
jgi:hypothetical protein